MKSILDVETVSIELERALNLLVVCFEELEEAPKHIDKSNQWSAVVFCENRIDILEALLDSSFSLIKKQKASIDDYIKENNK